MLKQKAEKSPEGIKTSYSPLKSGNRRFQRFTPISFKFSGFRRQARSAPLLSGRSKNLKNRPLKIGALFLCLTLSAPAFPGLPVPQAAAGGAPNGPPPFHGFSGGTPPRPDLPCYKKEPPERSIFSFNSASSSRP